jgi:WD40 repeat protein
LISRRNNQAEPDYEFTPAMWELADGKRVEAIKFEPLASRVSPYLEWSPDGKRIVVTTSGTDQAITVHDAETGRVEATLDTASRGGRIPLGARPAFSADGRRIACAVDTTRGRFVKVWDAATGRELLALPSNERGERGPPRSLPHLVAFSPDGNRLLNFALKQPIPVGPRGFGGAGLPGHLIDVSTWDATPRERPKKP